MKKSSISLFTVLSLSCLSVFAQELQTSHPTCQVVLSLGGYGKYAMDRTYKLDMDGYAKLVKKSLQSKGYEVLETLNYGTFSAFGKEGIQRAKDHKALAFEFRIAAPSYDYDGTEKHRCGGGVKLTDPKSEVTHTVRDSDGTIIGEFTTYQPLHERELETEISRWVPLRSQCQSVFNALVKALPTCSLEK